MNLSVNESVQVTVINSWHTVYVHSYCGFDRPDVDSVHWEWEMRSYLCLSDGDEGALVAVGWIWLHAAAASSGHSPLAVELGVTAQT